jgi:hypothetical protein
MLNIIHEKIFNPPQLGFEVSIYWQKLDLQLLTCVTILPVFQDGRPFILPPRLGMEVPLHLIEIQVMCPQSHCQVPEQ